MLQKIRTFLIDQSVGFRRGFHWVCMKKDYI
jgi:hypothetical protein